MPSNTTAAKSPPLRQAKPVRKLLKPCRLGQWHVHVGLTQSNCPSCKASLTLGTPPRPEAPHPNTRKAQNGPQGPSLDASGSRLDQISGCGRPCERYRGHVSACAEARDASGRANMREQLKLLWVAACPKVHSRMLARPRSQEAAAINWDKKSTADFSFPKDP